jgi:hypothetical protein
MGAGSLWPLLAPTIPPCKMNGLWTGNIFLVDFLCRNYPQLLATVVAFQAQESALGCQIIFFLKIHLNVVKKRISEISAINIVNFFDNILDVESLP